MNNKTLLSNNINGNITSQNKWCTKITVVNSTRKEQKYNKVAKKLGKKAIDPGVAKKNITVASRIN